jgi:hypothetical protein
VITKGVKVLIPARHGLGDVLHGYFIGSSGRRILARVRAGLEKGQIASAMVVYEEFYNPSVGDLFRALPLDLTVKTTADLWEILDQDGDNRMPDVVRWHQNIYTNPPVFFEGLDDSVPLDCPITEPSMPIPGDFVLLADGARQPDRLLTDPAIYDFLREVTKLPIVKIGRGHDAVPADVNLCNKLSITEALFVASRARVAVSALTMVRTFSSLFGIPVIELAERPSPETLHRTQEEYLRWQYGMQPALNKWFLWPKHRQEVREALQFFVETHRG